MEILWFAVISYVTATVIIWLKFIQKINLRKLYINSILFVSILSHGIILYQNIETDFGQNLTIFNILSLSTWLTTIAVVFCTMNKKIPPALVFLTPLAGFTILLGKFFQHDAAVIKTIESPMNLIHILIATTALCTLILAGIQAILAIGHNYFLKNPSDNKYLKALAPLESTEKSLFKLITIGFSIVSVMLISLGFMSFQNTVSNVAAITLGAIIWLAFGSMIYQRKKTGLRGFKTNLAVLVCAIILIISFFSHQYLI